MAQAATGTIAGHVKLTARVRTPLPSNVSPSRTIGKHTPPAILLRAGVDRRILAGMV
jgi:hypothetical protein